MKKHLEYKDEESHKFWEIEEFKTSFTVTYGKVGTNGQSKTKEFDNKDDMLNARAKLIDQKIKKGYKSSFTIIAEKWQNEIDLIVAETAKNSVESIEKITEWYTVNFTFNLEFKMTEDEVKSIDKEKVLALLKTFVEEYQERNKVFKEYQKSKEKETSKTTSDTSEAVGNFKKYLEYKDEKSHKFWEIEVDGNSFTVKFGKIEGKVHTRCFDFDTREKALLQAKKMIEKREVKGYIEAEK